MIKTLKRYVKIFHGVKVPWLLLLVVLIISVVLANVEVKAVMLTASIIDASKNAIKTQPFVEYIAYLVAVGALSVAYYFVSGLAFEKIKLGVRIKLWNKIMKLPMSYYDADNGNELVSRVTTDANSSSYYFELAISVFSAVYATVVTFQQLFSYNASLAAWTLIVIPVTIAISILYGLMTYRAGALSKNTLAAVMGYLSERVSNFRLIKSFEMEEKEQKRAESHFQSQYKAEMLLNLSNVVQSVGISVVTCTCIVIAFVFGGQMVAEGKLTTGRLVSFYTLSTLAAARISMLYAYFGMFTRNNGIMKKVSEILDTAEENSDGVELDLPDADIHFDHVNFSYGNKEVLRDVVAVIPKGKITAIIGPNGAGKTTLFKLLERMYQPDSGAIRFGKVDISEFELSSWRKSFAMVAQEKPLVTGTIRENILYGVERCVSEEELIGVAKMANVYDFVCKMPEGLDTQVGPGGASLSGGQQQCVAIARAMMRNPDYLLLDEATSNLDVMSEHNVSTALANLMKNRTTVMIAHSYLATQNADNIIVMRNGTVEAAGTPKEMLETNAYYQNFAKEGMAAEV